MLSKVQIKTIRALQHKKYRQKYSQFIAEGLKVVSELLQTERIKVDYLCIMPAYKDKIADLTPPSTQLYEVTEQELKKISCLKNPQGVLAVCTPLDPPPLSLPQKTTLLLDAIRDPGNMGTIIRIADWFGIQQIVCSPDCVDCYNAKTIQATMGSIARIPVYSMEPKILLQGKKKVPALAATLDGVSIATIKKIKEGIIIIGNESNGLSEEIIQLADTAVTIPRIGKAESLNAAVATGIICSRLCL